MGEMMTQSVDDSTLFIAIAEGDMDAFQALVTRYNDRIVGFLCRFLNDHDFDPTQFVLEQYHRYEANATHTINYSTGTFLAKDFFSRIFEPSLYKSKTVHVEHSHPHAGSVCGLDIHYRR